MPTAAPWPAGPYRFERPARSGIPWCSPKYPPRPKAPPSKPK